jgi:hypothetical protein
MLCYNVLPLLCEKVVPDFMEEQGFVDQQWKSDGFIILKFSKYYGSKLMCNSPELMLLDSSLFDDPIEGVALHVVRTVTLAKGG